MADEGTLCIVQFFCFSLYYQEILPIAFCFCFNFILFSILNCCAKVTHPSTGSVIQTCHYLTWFTRCCRGRLFTAILSLAGKC